MCVRETVFVEEGLPLGDHALLFVVEDDDLDGDLELGGGGEFGEGHVEGGVAVDVCAIFGNERVSVLGLYDWESLMEGEWVDSKGRVKSGDRVCEC